MKTAASAQRVDLFREIMVLPMRISQRENWKELLCIPLENWTIVEGLENRTPLSRAFVAQPLRNENAIESEAEYQARQAYGEAAYFHPFVQKFLYGWRPQDGKSETIEDKSMLHYRRTDFDRVSVAMDYGYGGEPFAASTARSFQIDLAVERIDLHVLPQPGVIFLVVEVAATAESILRRFDENKKPVKGEHKLSMAEVLALLDGLRRIYPPFFTYPDPEKKPPKWDVTLFPRAVEFIKLGASVPDLMEQHAASEAKHALSFVQSLNQSGLQPAAPWWADILKPLAPEGLDAKFEKQAAINIRYIVDERMPSMAFVSVPSLHHVSRSDQIRLCFADHGGEGLPYSTSFAENFEAEHCYDRFFDLKRKDMKVRCLFSSYSFVALCETGTSWPLSAKDGSFALDVLQEHFRRHYFKMFLIAQIHRASLLSFSHWLSQAVGTRGSSKQIEYRRKIADIRQSFVSFTHDFWFSNVSSQEQARDIFGKMQKHFGNAELYAEVKAEAEQARDELAEIAVERQADATLIFNAFIGIATLVGIPLSFLSVLPSLTSETQLPSLTSEPQIKEFWFWGMMSVFMIVAGLLTAYNTYIQGYPFDLFSKTKTSSTISRIAYTLSLFCVVAGFVAGMISVSLR
jgi:hypothetical protein